MAMAAAPTIVARLCPALPSSSSSSHLQCGVAGRQRLFCSPGSLQRRFGGEESRAVTLSSRPWRTTPAAASACRALNSDDLATPPSAFVSDQPQVFYFAVANAQTLMLEGAPLESVLQDGIERAERARRARDVWLIMEPAFLNQHPGLKALNSQLTKPTAAILSTNADWVLSFVKKSLPQAVIGKFISPSTAVPDPLKSNLNSNADVVGGGGVWH